MHPAVVARETSDEAESRGCFGIPVLGRRDVVISDRTSVAQAECRAAAVGAAEQILLVAHTTVMPIVRRFNRASGNPVGYGPTGRGASCSPGWTV